MSKVQKLNPLDALHQFISDVSPTHMPDIDLVILLREKYDCTVAKEIQEYIIQPLLAS